MTNSSIPRIKPQTIQNWTDLDSIKATFVSRGFPDIRESPGELHIPVNSAQNTFLRIIEQKNVENFHQHLDISTPYLFVVGGSYDAFTLIKQYNDPVTARRKYKKYRFSKDGLQTRTASKLDSALKFDEDRFDDIFDVRDIVWEFYAEFSKKLEMLEDSIEGIRSEKERKHYAEVLFYRILFCYFIQTRNFLNEDDGYLGNRFSQVCEEGGNFYLDFLRPLFFHVLNTQRENRLADLPKEFKRIPFLNGGLFRSHAIEDNNPNINIPNEPFKAILEFLSSWVWHTDEDSEFDEKGVNPEILGHIFENTLVNRRGAGAYYTPVDITQFINDGTIIPYCLERVNEEFSKNYHTIENVLKHKEHSEWLYFEVLCNMKVLDNACGSGEFLLSTLKLLLEIYTSTWDVIKNRERSLVYNESQRISGAPSTSYYFREKIINDNLFGVDLEEGAVEICKLRLWLSLVSETNVESVKALPNIDYNILTGNSLIGYTILPPMFQERLDGPNSIVQTIAKIESLKAKFRKENDPDQNKSTMSHIRNMLKDVDHEMTAMRINELSKEAKKKHHKKFSSYNPFHWRLHFNSMFSTGGFDIIVGNPPYIQKKDLQYPVDFFKTEKCANSYAYFFETSLQLLKAGGRIGYIVPVSSISTPNMAPLRQLLVSKCSELKISSYDDYPEKIFDGGKTKTGASKGARHSRTSVILGKIRPSACTVYTTGYKGYFPEERPDLFKNIEYIESTKFMTDDGFPKLGEVIELQIMSKINNKPSIENLILPSKKGKKEKAPVIWFNDSPQFWIHALDFMPPHVKNVKSSHTKPLYVKNNKARVLMTALLNSSLFYWFFIKTSSCRNLSFGNIGSFRISIDDFSPEEIKKLEKRTKQLMANLTKNATGTQAEYRHTGKVTYKKFSPRYAKDILDKIDDVLMIHYGFTSKEKEFIKSFDEKYRMGVKSDVR